MQWKGEEGELREMDVVFVAAIPINSKNIIITKFISGIWEQGNITKKKFETQVENQTGCEQTLKVGQTFKRENEGETETNY